MIDHGNGTVTDERTGLMWEQGLCPVRYAWVDATKVRIAELNAAALGGHTDWRLPTRAELVSLIEDTRHDPWCDPILTCQSSIYWSATTCQDDPSSAWLVFFLDGDVYADVKGNTYYVRGVRGGSLTLRSFDAGTAVELEDLRAERDRLVVRLGRVVQIINEALNTLTTDEEWPR